MKKIVAFILVLSLGFTMAGCGINNNPFNSNKSQEIEIEETDVQVTIPLSLLQLSGQPIEITQIDQVAKAQGMKGAVMDDEKSLTYIMTDSKHKEMVTEMKESLMDTKDDLITGNDFPSFVDIRNNEEFSEFHIVVDKSKYESGEDRFGMIGIVFESLMYQLFNGAGVDEYETVVYVEDQADGKVFNTLSYPEAFAEE